MIKKHKKTRFKPKTPKVTKDMTFSYKRPNELRKFMTEQGSILSRFDSGLSQKQQRRLTTAIKRARQLVMLPFTQTLK